MKNLEVEYVKSFHPNLIYNTFYDVGSASRKGVKRISEDTIQNLIDNIIDYNLKNTDYTGTREKVRRFDHCIYRIDQDKKKNVLVAIELKTYFKKNEEVQEKEILEDISKLMNFKVENPDVRPYILLVGLTSKLKRVDKEKVPLLSDAISKHISNCRKEIEIDISSITPKSKSKKAIKGWIPILRPSIKKIDNNICCLSWAVKIKKGE